MPVRGVRIYPDPVLKQVASPVEEIDDDARALAVDLVDTMRSHPRCVGLAANQVGALRRCVVVDVTGHPRARSSGGLIVIFDPAIEFATGAEIGREGCLSVPDLTANVSRATELVVLGLAPDGSTLRVEATAFEARALAHEIDHLDGILFLDRVASLDTDVFRRSR